MIKVNLLEGAADTRAQVRATKAATKTTQQLLTVVSALVLLLVLLATDYWISSARLEDANAQLAEQQRIAAELEANRKKKDELEKQIKAVRDRIQIIEDLEKTARGPSAMLVLINAKLPGGVTLDQIQQRGSDVTVLGTARDELTVSDFARALELGSDGLFQQMSFVTERKEIDVLVDPTDPENKETRREAVFNFTLSSKYTPTQVGQPAAGAAAGAPAAPPAVK